MSNLLMEFWHTALALVLGLGAFLKLWLNAQEARRQMRAKVLEEANLVRDMAEMKDWRGKHEDECSREHREILTAVQEMKTTLWKRLDDINTRLARMEGKNG